MIFVQNYSSIYLSMIELNIHFLYGESSMSLLKSNLNKLKLIALLSLTLSGPMTTKAQSNQPSQNSKKGINKEISIDTSKDQPVEDYLVEKAVLFMVKTGLDKETFTIPEAYGNFYLSFSKNGITVINKDQKGSSLCGINGPNGFKCYISNGNDVKETKDEKNRDLLLFALSSPQNPYSATNSPSNNPYISNSSSVNYEFTDQGYSGSYQTDKVDVNSLLPKLTKDPSSNEFVCGPLRGSNNTILLAQAQATLCRIVVEDHVYQELSTKSQLTEQERNFVEQHAREIGNWGLTRNKKGELQREGGQQSSQTNVTHIYHSTSYSTNR